MSDLAVICPVRTRAEILTQNLQACKGVCKRSHMPHVLVNGICADCRKAAVTAVKRQKAIALATLTMTVNGARVTPQVIR